MELIKKKCVPCEGGVPRLSPEAVKNLLAEVSNWEFVEDRIHKTFKFKKFMGSIQFVDEMAKLAEAEGHHPNFCVNFREVEVTIWTHAIGGLSENDFILAAKIDTLGQ